MMRTETIGGVSLADVRAFMVAVERRPSLLNKHDDVRHWIGRMCALLDERDERQNKRPRPHAAGPATAPAPAAAPPAGPPRAQSRIPVSTWKAQAAPAAPVAEAAAAAQASAKPLPELAAGGAAAAAALAAARSSLPRAAPTAPCATPSHGGAPAAAPICAAASMAGAAESTPAPNQFGRLRFPLGPSPFLHGGQDGAPTPVEQPAALAKGARADGAAASPPSAAAMAAAGIEEQGLRHADGAGTRGGGGGAEPMQEDECDAGRPAPSESALGTTPSMGSPPNTTRRLRPRAGAGLADASPSLSTPSFAASPPRSTRRMQPPRAHGSAARAHGAGHLGLAACALGAEGTPSLPSTPRFSASPLKSVKCKRQERGSLGWSEASSPPRMPTFDAGSPPRTVRPAPNPHPLLPAGASSERGTQSAGAKLQARAGRQPAPSPMLLDLDSPEDTLSSAILAASALGLAVVRADGSPALLPARLQPECAASVCGEAVEAEGEGGGDAGAACAQPQPQHELDLERFPRMFRQPHSEGAQRLREVYAVLRGFHGPLSAADIEELLPAGKYGAQLVTFLLDLLASRAYLYTQLDGDNKCWRAV